MSGEVQAGATCGNCRWTGALSAEWIYVKVPWLEERMRFCPSCAKRAIASGIVTPEKTP